MRSLWMRLSVVPLSGLMSAFSAVAVAQAPSPHDSLGDAAVPVGRVADDAGIPVAAVVSDGGPPHGKPGATRARRARHLNLTPPPPNGATLPPLPKETVKVVPQKESPGKAVAKENAAAAPVAAIPDVEPKLRTAIGDFGMMGMATPDDTRAVHPTGLAPPREDPHGATIPVTITFQPNAPSTPDAGDYGVVLIPKTP